jgi:hypothetical protein
MEIAMTILEFFRKTAKNQQQIRMLRIVERLRTRATLQDFLAGFYDDFNHLSTVAAIEDALDKEAVRRHDLGCTLDDLEHFYRRHVLDLFERLYDSFGAADEHWPTAESAFYGLNCFVTFVTQNEYAKHIDPGRIEALFEKRIDLLFRNERPGSTEEQIKEYIRIAGDVY